MTTLSLPVIESITDQVCFSSTETADVPEELLLELLNSAPTALLRTALPPHIRIDGFRSAATAPHGKIMGTLKRLGAPYITATFTTICLDAIRPICEKSATQIMICLTNLISAHGEAKIRYALLLDRRKSVRKLVEWISDACPTHVPDPVAALTSAEQHAEAQPARETAAPIKAPPDTVLQKQVHKLEHTIKDRDNEISKLRQDKGVRDRMLGDLRQTLAQKDTEIRKLQKQLADAKALANRLKQTQEHADAIVAREAQVEKRERYMAAIYGAGAAKLKEQLLEYALRIHDLETRLTGLNLLLQAQTAQRGEVLRELGQPIPVPVRRCVDVLKHQLEGRLHAGIQQVGDCSLDAEQRIKHVANVTEILQAISVLDRLGMQSETVPSTSLVGDCIDTLTQRLLATEDIAITLRGSIRYEGPNAWLVADNHVIGIPTHLLGQEDLVTGDVVGLSLYHDSQSLIDFDAEILERTERVTINDALRCDEDGLYIQTGEGRHLSISQLEFMRAGIEIGSPVQVLAPAALPPDLGPDSTIFCRINRKLDDTQIYPCSAAVGRLRQRRKEHHAPESEELLPILSGCHFLLVGGDTYKQGYQTIIESMGGRMDWQSGFGQLARISAKVSAADIVVLVTGCMFHAAAILTEAVAKRAHKPVFYLNSLGRTSFIRFMEQLAVECGISAQRAGSVG